MKITPLKVLRIDADKTLRLSVAFPVYRIVPVRGSKISVGIGRRESMAHSVTVKTFGGIAKDVDWKREFEALKSKIDNPDDVDLSEYHRAGYDPPFKPFNRRNEVWIVKKTSSVVDPQTPTD
ncbi:heme-binding protein 1 [Trichonephila clavipes]|uniref:Heme-binding protein 1 n=1 Tax=Trichonephila clavipes TaxID=2585209 RepID=A0A8X6WLN8_TRICX|nr:heme-binding protein 1 [Trichonephila clavipes]